MAILSILTAVALTAPPRLQPLALEPLPLGSIHPQGWLARQLRIQADGLSGHLDEFWPDVRDSGWIGGKDEGWERMPYWLDGVVPLAYLLDDPALKAKVEQHLDYILTHQQEDGWLGPEKSESRSGKYKPRDPWPPFVMLKALMQYQEATGDSRVIPAMLRFCRCLDAQMDQRPLFDWNKSRWQDLVVSLQWLYDRTGEAFLLDLARKAHDQGYDWVAHFGDLPFKEKADKWRFESHVVNHGMAVKTAGVWYRQTGDPALREAALHAIAELDRYHGTATGIFTGDECLAGKMPSQGTELCAVVEYMYSLEVLSVILGDVGLADRLERIAFNALPATFKPDMWAHQYVQQANQVVCKVSPERVYTNNGEEANLFGLEPNYGCCLANMHQGWPKFAAHLWMRTPDGGLAAVALAPSEAKLAIGEASATATLDTAYPFEGELRFTIAVDRPAAFPFLARVPAWADGATVQVGDGAAAPVSPGAFHRVERTWEGRTTVVLRLPMRAQVERRYHESAAISRGPLVYSLKIGENWVRLRGEEPHADWEVFPTTSWNYAIQLNPAAPDFGITFETRPVGDCPFSPDGAPVLARVPGRLLPEWTLERNAAAPPPRSPAASVQPLETLTLIPYGCTNLRVTEFPVLGDGS
ncbi:MAG: glycoside hydrolase family 127 protein [Candidatus Hydrogenedentes bacterium]|nr:glycoside hydrolase family 127 protein [Candidatus Hydrogenedentota bacterium]